MRGIKAFLRLLTVIPLLSVLVGVNYYEDPANIFHDASPKIAEAILEGNQVYYGSANGDERAVKACIIECMPKHVDCIVIGSSVTMGINRELAGTDSFYNLAASNFNFNDVMATFALLEENGIEYDRVILSADSLFFDETLAEGMLDPSMMPYAEYMIGRIEGRDVGIHRESIDLAQQFNRLGNYFSVTYFQSCLDYIESNGSVILPTERWGIMNENTQDLAHYDSDGSWEYTTEYRNNPVDFVYAEAGWYEIESVFARDSHISSYHQAHFRMLIDYLTERGIQVDLFLCPLSPALWDRLESEGDHYFILDEIEQYQNEIAAEYGLRVIGSFNPYAVGVNNEDYMDSRHIRHDILGDFFDFG